MLFTKPELTSGFRPILQPNEAILFVQDNVGLYEGKYKLAQCQKGHAYLTSHRVCYVDDIDPRLNSLAIELRDVEKHELQAGFLRSSAKIILYPKPPKAYLSQSDPEPPRNNRGSKTPISLSSPVTRANSPLRSSALDRPRVVSLGTWICLICSFSNPVPSNFDLRNATPTFVLPPCLACGIKPPFSVVLKAAINASKNQGGRLASSLNQNLATPRSPSQNGEDPSSPTGEGTVTCPRCTFQNHASLLACELCGTPFPKARAIDIKETDDPIGRHGSPGPSTTSIRINEDVISDGVRLSFRGGGERPFYEKLKSAMIQRKWLLESAPPTPQPQNIPNSVQENAPALLPSDRPRSTPAGIAALEHRGLQIRRDNETVIGTAFEDLEALMASAKEVVALAEKFASESASFDSGGEDNALLSESAAAIGIVTTRDKTGDGSSNLYVSELSRNLAEYLSDENQAVLRAHGGIISLVDLWAIFNRSRNGIELISPADFLRAAELWEKLGLPVRLRQFKSGLLVVQQRAWTDQKILDQLQSWLCSMKHTPTPAGVPSDWTEQGCGVAAQDVAQRFGWSLGVAAEELEMAEDKGLLCRDESIEGLRFWLNAFLHEEPRV